MAQLIAKGLRDKSSGKEVLIQGAGTKFYEALNAIAIGTDTVAIGNSQFVFGRSNVAMRNKVEIVGAGSSAIGEYSLKTYTAAGFYADTVYESKKDEIKSLGDIEISYWKSAEGYLKSSIVPHTQQNTLTTYEIYKVVKVNKGAQEYTYAGNTPVEIKVGDVLIRAKGGNENLSGALFVFANDYLYLRPEDNPDAYRKNPDEYVHTFSIFTTTVYAVSAAKNTSFGPKNIRTLSWDGTQWNAGDVTCDDGHGGLISLRELALRNPGGEGGTSDMIINGQNSYIKVVDNGGEVDDEIRIGLHCANQVDECQHVLNRDDVDNIFGYTGQVTQGSSRLVTSGAVYTALQNAVSAYLPVYVSLLNNGVAISTTGTSDSTHGLDALFNAASDGKIYMFNLSLSISSGEMWTMPALVKVDSSNQKRIAYIATGEDIIKVVKNLQNNSISISHENSAEGPVSKFFGRSSQSGSTDPASDIAIVAFDIDSSGVVTLASQKELVASIISQEAVGQRYIVLVRLWNKATNTIVEVPAVAETRSMTDNAQAYIGAYLNVGTKCIVIRKWTESGNITVVTQDLDNIFAAQN